jgi:hypothetical protein
MGILSFLGFIIGFIWFLLRLFKKGKKKQPLIFMLICFVTFIVSVSMYDDSSHVDNEEKQIERGETLNISDLHNYEWGDVAVDALNSIGVEEIEEIKTEVVKDSSVSFKITTSKGRLWIWVESNYSDIWSVKWIKDYDSHNYYYINEEEKYVGDSLLKEDIYSFETGEIKEKADVNAVKAYYDNLETEREKERAKREKEEMEAITTEFLEIYNAFKSNELVANDKYKGNRYTMIGRFETVEEDGLFNTLFKEIGVTVIVKVNDKTYNLWCKFDESEREKLKKYSKGDIIKFTGECISWGSWTDCKVE